MLWPWVVLGGVGSFWVVVAGFGWFLLLVSTDSCLIHNFCLLQIPVLAHLQK